VSAFSDAQKRAVWTCLSCRWSQGRDDGLWCLLKNAPAVRRCAGFEYDPGTDEGQA
jgi:hypothetical protein